MEKCSCTSEAHLVPWKLRSAPQCHLILKNRDITLSRKRCHDLWLQEAQRLKLRDRCPFRCNQRHYPFTTNVMPNFYIPPSWVYDYHFKILSKSLMSFGGKSTTDNNNSTEQQIKALIDSAVADSQTISTTGTVCELQLLPQLNHVQTVQEELAYPETKFLSEIGGILGLWLGFSLITIIEVLELILRTPFILFCFMRGKHVKPTVTPETTETSSQVTGPQKTIWSDSQTLVMFLKFK